MLFEIAFILMAFILPLFCFLSFRWGYKYGSDGKSASEAKIEPHFFKKSYKPSEEIERFNQELENIANYTGDATGQVKL